MPCSYILVHFCRVTQDHLDQGEVRYCYCSVITDIFDIWFLINWLKKTCRERERKEEVKKKRCYCCCFFQTGIPTYRRHKHTHIFFFFFSSQSQKVLTKYHTTCFQAVLLVNADMVLVQLVDKHNHAIYQQNKVNLLTKSFWFQ